MSRPVAASAAYWRLTLTLTLTLALAPTLAPLLVEVEHEGARALDHPPAAQRGVRHPARA